MSEERGKHNEEVNRTDSKKNKETKKEGSSEHVHKSTNAETHGGTETKLDKWKESLSPKCCVNKHRWYSVI